MDLILIRHGKAVELDSNLYSDDFNRPLTEDGVKHINIMSFILNTIVKSQGYKNLELISSSSTRTAQTAKIIANTLDLDTINLEDSLYHGDYHCALPMLTSKFYDSDCIIIVGHNPNLFMLAYNLCGLELEFKKGAIACFKLEENLCSGTLKFFLSGDLSQKMNLSIESNIKKPLKNIYLGINISDVKFEIFSLIDNLYIEIDEFKTNSEDPEKVHNIRLYIRQILTLLDFVKMDLEEDSYKDFVYKLKSMNKELSIIRDMDQFINYVKNFETTEYFKCVSFNQRKHHESEILYKINSGYFDGLKLLFLNLKWINRDDKLKHPDAYIHDLLLAIKKNNPKVVFNSYDDIHKLRVIGKKIKNILEIFPDSVRNKTLLLKKDNLKFVRKLGIITDYYNSIKILDVLYKLSFTQNFQNPEIIDLEYANLDECLRKDLQKKLKKITTKKLLGE